MISSLATASFTWKTFNRPIAMEGQSFDLPMHNLASKKCKVGGSLTKGKHCKDKQWGCNAQLSSQLTGREYPQIIKYPIISDE